MANVDVTRIAGNIGALNALTSLQSINSELAIHQTRLATGKRLNEAADDPAGMTIATTFDVRRQAMQTVLNSIGDAKNLLATAEGGLKKIQDIAVKMRNKSLEAVGDTLGTAERTAVNSQLDSYMKEINDIVDQTSWNGTKLIGSSGSANGATPAAMTFLTDVNGSTSFTFQPTQGYGAQGLGIANSSNTLSLQVDTSAHANTAVTTMDTALDNIKKGISYIGSQTARINFKEEALTVQYTNTEAAYNRIMNANMAQEQVEASKYAILQQTSTAMLSQANSAPQFLLSLFR